MEEFKQEVLTRDIQQSGDILCRCNLGSGATTGI